MERLTGVTWSYNGLSQDYCFEESIKSLQEFCDKVIVLDAGSTDGTDELIKSLQDKKTEVILCDTEEWLSQRGKWKLSYFTNKALDRVQTDWFYYQQADEITHEDCYDFIRKAIEGDSEAHMITRINLWASPYMQLNVPLHRMPCSTHIVRLAKAKYRAYDDAESIAVIPNDAFVDLIRMYHMGFVRKREVHHHKIRHMQQEVFEVTPDSKLEGMTIFDPYKWFSKEELMPIQESLPAIIQKWAIERYYHDK